MKIKSLIACALISLLYTFNVDAIKTKNNSKKQQVYQVSSQYDTHEKDSYEDRPMPLGSSEESVDDLDEIDRFIEQVKADMERRKKHLELFKQRKVSSTQQDKKEQEEASSDKISSGKEKEFVKPSSTEKRTPKTSVQTKPSEKVPTTPYPQEKKTPQKQLSDDLLSGEQLQKLLDEEMKLLKTVLNEEKKEKTLIQDLEKAIKDNSQANIDWNKAVDDLIITVEKDKKASEKIKEKQNQVLSTDSKRKTIWKETYRKFLNYIELYMKCRKLYRDIYDKEENTLLKFQAELTLLQARSNEAWNNVKKKADELRNAELEFEVAFAATKEAEEKLLNDDNTEISIDERNKIIRLWNKTAEKAQKVIQKTTEYKNSISIAENIDSKVASKELMLKMKRASLIKHTTKKNQEISLNIKQLNELLQKELSRQRLMTIFRCKIK
ncbi:MAG: hypothetical protein IJT36_04520 [Alphaproteobacteria bacterium]|nr:hypothetical protein [Alphaproteobacteria bacterium]